MDYDIGWIISSHVADVNRRVGPGVEKWRELADVCERFVKGGRGLFVFADNHPWFAHANVVLERLVGVCINMPYITIIIHQ